MLKDEVNSIALPSNALILLIATVTSFMTAFMGSSLNIALPVIGKEFQASAVQISWLSTIYLLTTAALLIPVGRFSDLKGRVIFFKSGIVLFTTGSLLSAAVNDITLLLITRAVQGFGSAFIFSTSTAILVSAYPKEKRGKALGINVAAVYVGLSSGPFLGGLITSNLNWRGIFILNALMGLVISSVTFARFKREFENLMPGRYDYKGSIIFISAVVLLMIGLTEVPSAAGIILFTSGMFVFLYFYFYEKGKEEPLFDVKVFSDNRTFTFSNLAALINYSATFAVGFLLSFYLQVVKGLPPQQAGLILVTQPLVQAVFSPFAGRLSDKREPQMVSSIGMSFLTAGLIVLCFINESTEILIVVLNLIFLGIGFALFSSPNVNAIMSSVSKRYYGVASSTMSSMRMIGQMLSMGIVILIFNFFIGNSQISKANSELFLTSFRTAFIFFSIFSFLGIFASLARGSIHTKK